MGGFLIAPRARFDEVEFRIGRATLAAERSGCGYGKIAKQSCQPERRISCNEVAGCRPARDERVRHQLYLDL